MEYSKGLTCACQRSKKTHLSHASYNGRRHWTHEKLQLLSPACTAGRTSIFGAERRRERLRGHRLNTPITHIHSPIPIQRTPDSHRKVHFARNNNAGLQVQKRNHRCCRFASQRWKCCCNTNIKKVIEFS